MTEIRFTVPGQPVAKGRPKAARRGNFITMYTPEKTASYENLVKVKAEEAMQGRGLIEDAVHVEVRLYVCIPDSWSKKKKADALASRIVPTSKPDLDNCIKGIFDAMNGVVFADDKQVTDLYVAKRYSDKPRAEIYLCSIDFMSESNAMREEENGI